MATRAPQTTTRLRIQIRGAVQGVGFRPFVYRLARELDLKGWVLNSAEGLTIETEGSASAQDSFLAKLRSDCPRNAVIRKLEYNSLPPIGFSAFEIRHSDMAGHKSVQVLPDLAICPDCLREIFDPTDRRYRYPFANCTNCGPRFSIIEALPYDRSNTTMRQFQMCPVCRREYEDPADRRFHAQPNACPVCGPQLQLWDETGSVLAEKDEALKQAAAAIVEGRIVALKGLGGFQLLVDARSDAAVGRLRSRKRREEKPFALMFPDLGAIKKACAVSLKEQRLLESPAAPIVLLLREQSASVAKSVAPGNPYLGAMLPYTPLHALLLDALKFPVVATSGNLSEEPICTDEREALSRLRGIADLLLVHNRPIARHMDDSVVRIARNRPLLLRGARGYAPLSIALDKETPPSLAVGGHLKNTIAVGAGESFFISQHIGDLDSRPSYDAFLKAEGSLRSLYEVKPRFVACDLHPDYFSTQHAAKLGAPVIAVQHHHAHIVAAMAEHGLDGDVLGVSWDGSGYGPDGSVWGGEFLAASRASFKRVGHLRTFRLPGGDQAVREPRRSALGVLHAIHGDDVFEKEIGNTLHAFGEGELRVLRTMLQKKVHAPLTSSAGRLFDAVASLMGLRQKCSFEGQAAMLLEYVADLQQADEIYPYTITSGDRGAEIVDWEAMIREIIHDLGHAVAIDRVAAKFHNTLAAAIVAIARAVKLPRVVLSGGCFQNRLLLERSAERLEKAGFEVFWPQQAPPNDGGLALGQAAVAAAQVHLSPP